MKFLAEVNASDIEFLVESTETGPKGYYIQGPFLQADMKNRNGRIYPLHIMTAEANRYNNEYVLTKRALGELGHPDTTTVNMERASHIITNLTQDGKNFVGRAKVLDTTYGKLVKNFMDEGVVLGVSSRGFGSVENKSNAKYVCDDFHLSAVDIVHDPSGYHCFVEGIMESREYYFENGILVEKQYDEVKKMVKQAINEEQLFANLEKFFKTL